MKLAAAMLICIVAASLTCPRTDKLDRARLRMAIWYRESSCRQFPPDGDNHRSIGPYQVMQTRFNEYRLEGQSYRHMTPKKWHRWMDHAITHYLSDVKGSVREQVIHTAADHNGRPKVKSSKYKAAVQYRLDVWRFYKTQPWLRKHK